MSKWNEEDMTPHAGLWAVIPGTIRGTFLMQRHVKLGCWTIPVGKAPRGSDYEEAMKQELREECGIEANLKLLLVKDVTHFRDYGPVTMPCAMFLVTGYTGTITNLEPTKHTAQEFMNPNRLIAEGQPISDAVKGLLEFLRFHSDEIYTEH